MLTYYLDADAKRPLYEQLYMHLRQSIVSGEIGHHEKMPSKRMLSNHLKVSLSTVENAYTQLIAEGYVASIEKRGYFVVYDQSIVIDPPKDNSQQPKKTTQSQHPTHLHLNTNRVDAQMFMLQDWLKANKKLIDEPSNALINQSDPKGYLPLRLEIKAYLKQYRGMDVSEEQIIMGTGSEMLLPLIMDLLEGLQCIGIENPGYQKTYHIMKRYGTIVPIPLDMDGFDIASPKAKSINVIHITPSHQYPTGIVMPISRRLEILKWATEKKDRYIIEDDYDSEFRFTGQPIQALYALDRHQKVIYMNSFSKSLGPTMRLSYMVLPSTLLDLYETQHKGYHPMLSNLIQYPLYYLFSEGRFYKHLNKMKVRYRQKRDELIKQFKSSSFGHEINILNADAGLHFIMEHQTIDVELIAKNAHQFGLDVKTIQSCAYDDEMYVTNGLIIGYAHLDLKDMEEIVRIIEKSIKLGV